MKTFYKTLVATFICLFISLQGIHAEGEGNGRGDNGGGDNGGGDNGGGNGDSGSSSTTSSGSSDSGSGGTTGGTRGAGVSGLMSILSNLLASELGVTPGTFYNNSYYLSSEIPPETPLPNLTESQKDIICYMKKVIASYKSFARAKPLIAAMISTELGLSYAGVYTAMYDPTFCS